MKVTFFSGVAMAAIAADRGNATSLSQAENEVTLGQITTPTTTESEFLLSQQATTLETDADSYELAEVESMGSADSESASDSEDNCSCTVLA